MIERTSKMNSLWWVLVASAFLLSSTAGCRGQTKTKPPIHPNWNMDQQRRYDPQEPSQLHYDDDEPFFIDGRAMRTPVEGTVPTGWLLADDDQNEHYFEGTVAGEVAGSLPAGVVVSSELLARGQERFGIFCQPCHGMGGNGDGIVVDRGGNRPPSFHIERLNAQPVGYFFQVMTNGFSTMASYRSQVPVEDRWAIAAYIRTLQTTVSEGELAAAGAIQ